jgi:hypothetical protein
MRGEVRPISFAWFGIPEKIVEAGEDKQDQPGTQNTDNATKRHEQTLLAQYFNISLHGNRKDRLK